MKRYGSLTFRYLKTQRKRTVLTLLGVILSLVLISSIGTLFFSLYANQINQTIEDFGDHHFRYEQVDARLAQRLQNHAKVDRLAIVKKQAQIPLSGRASLQLNKINQAAMKAVPFTLKKGKTPRNPHEIMVEQWALKRMNPQPKLGETLDFKVHGKKQSYRLVGILKNQWRSQATGEGQAATFLSSFPKSSKLDLYVKLKPGVPIRENVSSFKEMAPKGKFVTNKELLRLLGEGPDQNANTALFVIPGILTGLVMLATIAVIYNAFHISVLERIKQFGVLRSIGATPKQIKNLVFREALLLCIIGIPLGILLGSFALKWMMSLSPPDFLMSAEDIVIRPEVIGISGAIGVLSVFASAFLPARLASKVSPLDAIQNRGSIKKESVKKSQGWLTKRLPIESAMALKNLRRNKKRYRITLFSMMISVILFVTFSSFVTMAFQVKPPGNEEEKVDFQLVKMGESLSPAQVEEVQSIKGIKAMPVYAYLFTDMILPSAKMTSAYTKAFPTTSIKDGNQPYTVLDSMVDGYDRQRLQEAKRYLQAGTIDPEKMEEENGVAVVVRNRDRSPKKENKPMDVNAADLQPGDEITLDINNRTADDKKIPKQVFKAKVTAVLDKSPYGEKPYPEQGIRVITTEKVFQRMIKQIDEKYYEKTHDGEKFPGIQIYGMTIKVKPKANREHAKTALQEFAEKNPSVEVFDKLEEKQQETKAKMQFSIMVYGFIGVITLIGAFNIINTISTNLVLRKQEFATLKAIGMTMSQIKKMIWFEGSLYGVTGAIYGLIIGLPLSYLLYMQFTDIIGFEWSVPWRDMAIASVGAVFIGLTSTLLPLRRIQKGNIIDDIRTED
ncbi:ABC transporter permease [Salinithrix halophila]|uniref:ABC transporter permease n=1 Tax=Salinithrix halophila TaxID=1485204 RepID=A0ABV8JLK3_9BACL